MKIGELSQITGASRDAIRLYEKMWLIESRESKSATNSYREYDERCLMRIKAIMHMKECWITLKEGKELFDAMSGGSFDYEFRVKFVRKKLAEIDEKIEKLQSFKNTIIEMGKTDCSADHADMIEKIK